jgi:hypothetical protein
MFPGSGWDGGHVKQLQQFYLYLLLAELTQATIKKIMWGFLHRKIFYRELSVYLLADM